MFKKILQSLSKSQSAKAPTTATQEPKSGPLSKVAPVAGIKAGAAKAATAKAAAPQTPEELCGITAKMPKSEIMSQLKLLYRRHNRGASSLDPKVRAQAEEMLHAIVVMREKHFGQI